MSEAFANCKNMFGPEMPVISNRDWEQMRTLSDILVPLELLTKEVCKQNCNILQVSIMLLSFVKMSNVL